MTDTLPDGVRLLNNVSANGAPVAFSADNGVLTAKLGNIAPGETLTVKYEVLVLEEAAGTTLKNTVVLSGKDGSSTSKVETPVEVPEKPNNPDVGMAGAVLVDKDVDKVTAKVGSDATAADRRVTYTVTATNDSKDKKTWEDVIFTDVLDDGIMTLLNDSIYADGVRLTANQFTYRNDCLTIELGDIAPGKSEEVKFSVQFKNDAGGKTFENEATATGMLSGEKTFDTDTAPIVTVLDKNVRTDCHYAIFFGDNRNMWMPGKKTSVEELATVAYRIMTNEGKLGMQNSGVGYVSDYVNTQCSSEVIPTVRAGILSSNEFVPSDGMVEREDYIVTETENGPHYTIWATKDQIGRVMNALFGNSYGTSGPNTMSRIDFAALICKIQGRDTNPDWANAEAEGMRIKTFGDGWNPGGPGPHPLITEVSNSHAYTMDNYGHEAWVYNEKMY